MAEFAGASGGIWSAPVALVVPTRGRPDSARDLIDAWGQHGVCSDLILCVDDDDPALGGYQALMGRATFHRGIIMWLKGPRLSLCGWTDRVASEYAGRYEALLSIGDDHRPETPAFDRLLLDACGRGGFAYGDDGLQHENLPTACLITSNVIKALGGMCLPGARHMFTDAYWRDLADAAGCRYYLPHVKTPHLHHTARLSVRDQTYVDGEQSWTADEAVYRTWLDTRMHVDALTVREAIG